VRFKTLVGDHVGDNNLRISLCRTPAGCLIIFNYREVSQKLCVKPMMRDYPQPSRCRICQLHVAPVSSRERQHFFERKLGQDLKLSDLPEPSHRCIQLPSQGGFIQVETRRRGIPLYPARSLQLAAYAKSGS